MQPSTQTTFHAAALALENMPVGRQIFIMILNIFCFLNYIPSEEHMIRSELHMTPSEIELVYLTYI